MKKIIVLYFLFVSFNLKSQLSLHFDVLYKIKYDIVDIKLPNNELKTYPSIMNNCYIVSGEISYKRSLVSLNYSNEIYYAYYDLKNKFSKYGFFGISELIEYGNNYGLTYSYYIFPDEKKINFLPGIGVMYINNSSTYSTPHVKKITKNGETVVQAYIDGHNASKSDYYIFVSKFDIIYKFIAYFSSYIRIGYNLGFKTMGVTSGWYEIKDRERKYIRNETKGSNVYFGIGIKVNFKLKDKINKIGTNLH